MGTFPPGSHRRSMDFYYPNPTNDFWRIMGLLFLGDKEALYDAGARRFDVDAIKALMAERHIALSDTALEVRRLKGNASDRHLEIVTPVPLDSFLDAMPGCRTVATTGEKAAGVIAGLTSTLLPRMGECVAAPSGLRIWRMPSTSRAYPMKLGQKAAYYRMMFESTGIL